MRIAPAGHFLLQSEQPMQPEAQIFFTAGPLSWLEQATSGRAAAGSTSMMCCGQVFVQRPQPVQRAGSTRATPPATAIAPSGQTAAQSP